LLATKAYTYFYCPAMDGRLIDVGTAVGDCNPYLRLYNAVAVMINTTACGVSNFGSLTSRSVMLPLDHCNLQMLFSERELTFTFAVCYRPSVCCLSVVCLSVVCNVRAPHSGGSNFWQYFYGIRYLGHPLTSTENFMEIVPGEPLRQGS